ncbi:hypothetical protein [Actinomadura oligospora]|uniref:hypothetical protein n=1 Tax=Actinomadura oligospora TaxID=111804 RepID=UPI0004B9A34A|nr:hypothetical protein [Actinomadura oligospora]
MAASIDEIDWASLGDAYGPADAFPQMLKDATDPDPEVRDEALHELFGSIYHQGTLYTATPYAVPFVVRAVTDPATPGRAGLVHLLGAIAETDDASPAVLADVRAALVSDVGLLLPLLDDPDAETRHVATHLLGHLPRETAAQVVPTLRTRWTVEQEPIVVAGLLAAAGRLAPETNAAWLTEELASGKPDTVRAGALWASSAAGLPWTDASAEALTDCWLNGEPLEGWIWSDRPYEDIVLRLDTPAFAAISRTILEEGPNEAARAAIDAVYERCVRSRSARAVLASLLAETVEHPDPVVRLAAAEAARDVPEATPLVVDTLAAHAVRITSRFPAVRAVPADEGPRLLSEDDRLLPVALDVLITLGDPRWREPLVHALDAGEIMFGTLGTLIDAGVPCDDVLLGAVRRRIAAWRAGQVRETYAGVVRHNEINALTRLVHHWGPDAADAVPDLVPIVPDDIWWTVRALGAIGEAASEAVPTLTRVRDTAEAASRRLQCAEAIAAITGDEDQLSAGVAAVAAEGEPSLAAQAALRHGLPLDDVLPALRATAARTAPTDDPAVLRQRLEAARLLLGQGEADPSIQVAADALDAGICTTLALELAGQVGRAAAGELDRRVRARLGAPHEAVAAALAFRRITGESEPLVAGVRAWLTSLGAGPWLDEPLRELGPDVAELLPELRELVDGDSPCPGVGIGGRLVREDEEARARLAALLAEPDA